MLAVWPAVGSSKEDISDVGCGVFQHGVNILSRHCINWITFMLWLHNDSILQSSTGKTFHDGVYQDGSQSSSLVTCLEPRCLDLPSSLLSQVSFQNSVSFLFHVFQRRCRVTLWPCDIHFLQAGAGKINFVLWNFGKSSFWWWPNNETAHFMLQFAPTKITVKVVPCATTTIAYSR